MLTSLHHIRVGVTDLKGAAERYRAFFNRKPISRSATEAWFSADNTRLKLIAREDKEGLLSMAFATMDLAKARHVLQRRGLPCIDSAEGFAVSPASTHGVSIEIIASTDTSTAAGDIEATSSVRGLDHVVVTTSHPERAAALYGARLGLEMKLDRTNPDWGSRLMFFKCSDLIVEIAQSLKNADPNTDDSLWGLSWRVSNIETANARLRENGFNVSDIRVGRKPGTRVFTIRDAPGNVPTIVLGKDEAVE